MDKNLKQGTLELVLLSALERRPMYGLEILKAVEEGSSGLFKFKEGSLYPSLHKLVDAGCIESEWQPSSVGGAPRKVYQITETGLAQLERKKLEWSDLRSGLDALLGLKGRTL